LKGEQPSVDIQREQANRALFDGEYDAVLTALSKRASTGAELWLLAAAVEDDGERLQLLKRVRAIGEQPYATLAADILRREAAFDEVLSTPPQWRRWLATNRDQILRFTIAGVILVATLAALVWLLR
jgi:hypothetical protein